MDINWTSGNGTSRILVIRQTTTTTSALPQDGRNYVANTNVASAGNIIPGIFVVYNGSGSGPVTVSGLIPGTNYTATVFEYNGSNASANYYAFTNNPENGTTTGSSSVLQRVNFEMRNAPLYMGSGVSNRTPVMFLAVVTGLLPNTTY